MHFYLLLITARFSMFKFCIDFNLFLKFCIRMSLYIAFLFFFSLDKNVSDCCMLDASAGISETLQKESQSFVPEFCCNI